MSWIYIDLQKTTWHPNNSITIQMSRSALADHIINEESRVFFFQKEILEKPHDCLLSFDVRSEIN